MFRNRMPRYEVLSADAMATLDRGWRRLMPEIGVEFMDERALELFRQAGQRVEDHTVFLDSDFVLEQVAKAPREFDVQARNPANTIHIGGDSMAFGAVAACASVSGFGSSSVMPFLNALIPLATSPISSEILPRPNSRMTTTATTRMPQIPGACILDSLDFSQNALHAKI